VKRGENHEGSKDAKEDSKKIGRKEEAEGSFQPQKAQESQKKTGQQPARTH
jgi:hypothetical protein